MTVMLLGGLWHGASWNFVLWGAIHGGMLAFERAQGARHSVYRAPAAARCGSAHHVLRRLSGWVFFRAKTLGQAVAYLQVAVRRRAP